MRALSERTVPAVLVRGAAEWSDKVALVCGDSELSYGDLRDRTARVAGGLAERGVGAGDSVALMLGNRVEHVLSWFGASWLNAVEVPLNTAFKPEQMAYVINHSEARVLVIEDEYLPQLGDAAADLPGLRTVVVVGDAGAAHGLPFEVVSFERVAAGPAEAPAAVAPQDTLGILYTSGTTGMPKGVLVSQAQTYGRMWPEGPGTPTHDDRTLVVLPIYHVIGQCRGLYNTLIAGGTAVLEPRFSASRFWETCRRHEISFVPLVGVMVSYLLGKDASPSDRDHKVRHIALGTTSPRVDEFKERFGVDHVSMSYGLTEAGGILVSEAEPAGCGYLRPDFDARLVDENDVAVEPGRVGELVLRPHDPWSVMTGYFKMPEATLAKWRNLWLHTGDLMWQREDGMYMFAGRRAERIRVRGENVSPDEVEEQILRITGVRECAVLGIDASDAAAGVGDQEILAAVVLDRDTGPDLPELVAHLEQALPKFAVPRFFTVYDELPRTDATHRVQRTAIAARDRAQIWDSFSDRPARGSSKGSRTPAIASTNGDS
jgi:carnitine-CoA ligase